MFNCEVCGETTKPGTKVHRIPAGYRETEYPERRKIFEVSVSWKKKPVLRSDPGGDGWELEGVLKACPTCYDKWDAEMKEEMLPDGVSEPDFMAA